MTVPTTTARRPAAGGATPDLLRTSLRIDSWGTAAFGVLLLVGSPWLDGPLGLPASWSVPLGIAMLGGAAALALIAGYPRIPERLSATVVVANALSCPLLLLLAFSDLVPLTAAGTVFLVIGAVVVAVFAELEFVGHRRARGDGRSAPA
ncbi:hypothetical protein ABT112_01270 [Streptomyces sp. NPDC002055]|uniref:hypothetical protein n=1 Tax=Streptomyces sp. NPDC002055 TaxID=3154534 RepID=UPI00331B547E